MVNFLRIKNPARRHSLRRVSNPLGERLKALGAAAKSRGSVLWSKAKVKGAEYGAAAKAKGAEYAKRGAKAVGRAAIHGAKVGSKFAAKHAAKGLQGAAGALSRYSAKPNPSLASRVSRIVDQMPINAQFRKVEADVRALAAKNGLSVLQTDKLVVGARNRFHKRLMGSPVKRAKR